MLAAQSKWSILCREAACRAEMREGVTELEPRLNLTLHGCGHMRVQDERTRVTAYTTESPTTTKSVCT